MFDTREKRRMKLFLRTIDLHLIFVGGFTFLITAINEEQGISYFLYLFLASLFLMIVNAQRERKKEDQNE
jgi:hypothetical protein